MKNIALHFWFFFKQSLRLPSFVFFTAIIPSIFYYFFAKQHIQNATMANVIMASFACFSFITAIFLQFSVQLCIEKKSSWKHFVASLPGQVWQPVLARVLNTVLFALLGALVVIGVVFETAEPDITNTEILQLLLAITASSIPFFFIAYLLAHFVSRQAVSTASTATYLILAIVGGMLIPPSGLPKLVQDISEYIPTRYMAEVAWSVVERSDLNFSYVAGLGYYSVGLGLIIIALKKKNLL